MSRKNFICVATIILVLAAIIGISIAFFHQSSGDKNNEPKDALSPIKATEILNTLFDSLKTDESENKTLLKEIEKKNGFEIMSSVEEGQDIVVTVKVYSPDIYTMAKELDSAQKFNSTEEVEMAIMTALKQANIVEKELELTFQNTPNGYIPIMTEEFLDAYYGGVFRLLNEFLAQNNE